MKRSHSWLTILGGGLAVALAVQLCLPPGGLPALAGDVVGQTPADLKYTNTTKVLCAATSTALYAATGSPTEKVIKVPAAATAGIHIGVGAAATANMLIVEPGETWIGSGREAVNCLRAGGSDVTTYLQSSTFGGYTP